MSDATPQLIELDNPPELGERFVDALIYAVRVHEGQRRGNDDQPYIAHLLRVAGFVIEDGGSENEAIAALLHDAPEEQGGQSRLAEIRRRYGEPVAMLVNECTDSFLRSRPPWRERKRRYVEELGDASSGALRVSLADKLDNVRALIRDYRIQGEALWARAGKRRQDVLWYYEALAQRFCQLRPGPMADELLRTVEELDQLVAH
jgi:(p)ppGpp synthase/HD superfamily hydrolase